MVNAVIVWEVLRGTLPIVIVTVRADITIIYIPSDGKGRQEGLKGNKIVQKVLRGASLALRYPVIKIAKERSKKVRLFRKCKRGITSSKIPGSENSKDA